MQKQQFYIVLLLLLSPVFVISQVTISGKILVSGEVPVEYIEVSVISEDSLITMNDMTDIEGLFSLDVPAARYRLMIAQSGSILDSIQVNAVQDIDVGVVNIPGKSHSLDEVVISARKRVIEKKIDRLVYNVENSIFANGGDALDVLRRTPRIKIQNDVVSIIGKGGMVVMIDDRIIQLTGSDLVNFLKTLKSEDIKSIEVITNPPAKYNAEGNSGILNIRLKKAKRDSWNGTLRAIYQQATNPSFANGASYNIQKGKITATTNLTFSNLANSPVETSKIVYPDILWKEDNDRRNHDNTYSGRVGIDYKMSDKVSAGIQFNRVQGSSTIDDDIRSSIYNRGNGSLDSIISTDASSRRARISNSLNAHFSYEIDTIGKVLSIDFDYFDFDVDSRRRFGTSSALPDNTIIPGSQSAANNIGDQGINNYSVNVDMQHPLKGVNLNYGGRLSFIKTVNAFRLYNIVDGISLFDPNQSDHFDYKENTQSVYFSAQKELSPKWDSKLGIRFETTKTVGHSRSVGESNTVKYTEFFPTAYLAYNPNDNNSFSINYGRRINRPGYNMLNPFKWAYSPYSYLVGDPFLQPSFSSNIEFEYAYKENLITSVYFSHLRDGFEQLTIVDPVTAIKRIVPKNFLKNKVFGVNQTVIVAPLKWWQAVVYGDIYYSATTSVIPETLSGLHSWNGEFSLNNDMTLNKSKTVTLNVSYSFTTTGVDNLDRNSQFDQLDIGVRMSVLKRKIDVLLYCNDVLSSSRVTYSTVSNNLSTSFRNYNDTRFFRVAVVYNFGKKFETVQASRKNDDEYERVK